MVRISVLYPNEDGKRFDHTYYAQKHLPLVMDHLKGHGMLRYEVDTGLAGGGAGPAPFVAACHLYFNAAADFLGIGLSRRQTDTGCLVPQPV
jgi:uncharacterized protein (TIGR02118 family)